MSRIEERTVTVTLRNEDVWHDSGKPFGLVRSMPDQLAGTTHIEVDVSDEDQHLYLTIKQARLLKKHLDQAMLLVDDPNEHRRLLGIGERQ